MPGQLHIITGGSGSGKSAYAESLAAELAAGHSGQLYYIATMEPFGEEAEKRIERHRKMRRMRGFETIECYVCLSDAAEQIRGPHPVVLLEDMGNLAANELFRTDGSGQQASAAVPESVRALLKVCDHLLIVTNEVFSDGIDYPDETKAYLGTLGEINRTLAGFPETVRITEVVYGIPVEVKQ